MRDLKVALAVILTVFFCILFFLFPPLESGRAVRPSGEPQILQRGVDFVYEKIILDIDPSELKVTGLYRFQNLFPFEVTLPLLYPFPVDEYQAEPHKISASIVTKKEGEQPLEVKLREGGDAAYLPVTLGRKSSAEMRVCYSQRLKAKRARYILTTTKAWGKPLKSADYQLILPEMLRINFISFPFDRVQGTVGGRIYFSHKENFMPDVDLIVTWE